MRLAGKVALITGAAAGVEGQLMGFGGAAARLFAREGARVVLTDIKEEMGFKTAEQIRASGGEALFVRHDVTSEEEWQEVIQTTMALPQVPCCVSCGIIQYPLPEELQLHPAIPTALDQLQAIDVAFDRPVRPGERQSRFDGGIVPLEHGHEVL